MQHPLTVRSCTPTQLIGPPAPSKPWKDPSASAEDRESGGKRQHWLGRLPAGRGRHRWAESARRGHCKGGVLSRRDKFKSWATGPQRLPPLKEYTLTLHLLGTAIRATFPLCPSGPLRPGPLHQRQAEGGHHIRPSPEAASTARPLVAKGPTTVSNPEEEPPNLQGGFCGCRASDQSRGLPSGGPRSTRRGCHTVPDPTQPPPAADNRLPRVTRTPSSRHVCPPHYPQLPDKCRSQEQWKPVG